MQLVTLWRQVKFYRTLVTVFRKMRLTRVSAVLRIVL